MIGADIPRMSKVRNVPHECKGLGLDMGRVQNGSSAYEVQVA
jgi:hypothetical protein